jgi:glycosyltransferase involved in cell wall biosynthesis
MLAVGRFVEKKAPTLTIRAFAEAHRAHPEARLRMIGDGPLLDRCRELVKDLAVDDAVMFLGMQPHETVEREMRRARCFVQHSVEAESGDSEGTPVGILEAATSGLPVISTRHGGISDVVVEGETGLLVEERDVPGMAEHMIRLIRQPDLAAQLGRAARRRAETHFSREQSLGALWDVIWRCVISSAPVPERGSPARW